MSGIFYDRLANPRYVLFNLNHRFSDPVPDFITFSVAMTLAGLRTFARIMLCLTSMTDA